jgi:hypothetical protein
MVVLITLDNNIYNIENLNTIERRIDNYHPELNHIVIKLNDGNNYTLLKGESKQYIDTVLEYISDAICVRRNTIDLRRIQ